MKVLLDKTKFLAKFKTEASEHLQNLNNGLLALEEDPRNEEVIDGLFREAHTLKGGAKMMGFTEISEIAHKIEDIFEKVKEEELALTEKISNLLFTGFDSIELLLKTTLERKESGIDTEYLCGELEKAAQGQKKVKGPAYAAPSPKQLWRVGDKASAGKQESRVRDEKQGAKKAKKTTEKEATTYQSPTAQKVGRRLEDREETVRVSTAKLDKLVNLTGELVISQTDAKGKIANLKALMRATKEQAEALRELRELATKKGSSNFEPEKLKEKLNRAENLNEKQKEMTFNLLKDYGGCILRQDRVAEELEEEVMELRMLPISVVFDAFPRAIRDLSKEYKKEIGLEIIGAETGLDKKTLEEIRDPLLHLVRNAVDHGIETPAEREKLGKPRKGRITLSANQEGDQAVIEITDDGAGMDPKNLRKTAVEKGFLTRNEAHSLSDGEALHLPFNPGFSTSSIITDVSGRGVGLDVVKKNVEGLKGVVSLASEPVKGTKVTLKLPLTLAISRALLVKSGGETFALPTTSVEETLRVPAPEIKRIGGKEALQLRGKTVPLARLDRVLQLEREEQPPNTRLSAVIIRSAGERLGFLIDELLDEREIVVKTLGNHLERVKNVAGATITEGEAVIILHLPELVNSAKTLSVAKSPPEMPKKREETAPSILVVEDSLTTRELEKGILQASGYQVEEAMDGIEALERVGARKFDLLVVDIQMPQMDGFQLTERLKKEEKYRDIPVVIVTAKARDEDKKRGIEAGADAYIVKSAFDQQNLLDTIERLLGRTSVKSLNG